MKIRPLVVHAGLQLPRWTSLFSDTLAVSTITVVSGGLVTLTCPSPHGVTVGATTAVSITDAPVPNPIIAATVDASGDIVLTTMHPHNLSASPNPQMQAYSLVAKLTGFASALINGTRDLVATPSPTTLVIRPGGTVASVTLSGSEALLEQLEFEITGWHKVTAASATTLTFAAPATVTRSYTVTSPTVVRNIRVFGAIDQDHAVAQLTIDGALQALDKGVMFILPHRVRTKGKFTLAGVTVGSDFRAEVDDGFTVLVFLPSTGSAAHIAALDMAQGDVFKAVLRTFMGLRILRSEICEPGSYVATFASHEGSSARTRAVYAHEYVFDAPFVLGNADAIAPYDWSVIDDGALTVPDSIYPVGSTPLDSVTLTGIFHKGHRSPLEGEFEMEG